MERLYCHPSIQICAVLAALINCITLFMGDFRINKFLPRCDGRFKVNKDMMFIEDPPEFLRPAN